MTGMLGKNRLIIIGHGALFMGKTLDVLSIAKTLQSLEGGVIIVAQEMEPNKEVLEKFATGIQERLDEEAIQKLTDIRIPEAPYIEQYAVQEVHKEAKQKKAHQKAVQRNYNKKVHHNNYKIRK